MLACSAEFFTKRLNMNIDRSVDLTYKEYEILKHLIRNKGIVLTRDRLMEIVWGYNFEQGNRTVDVFIYKNGFNFLGTSAKHSFNS